MMYAIILIRPQLEIGGKKMDILLTLIVAFAGGLIGLKLKIPAGALIGAMIAVAALKIGSGRGDLPYSFRIMAQIFVGGMLGLNFSMETINGLKNLIFPAMIVVVGLTLFSVILGFTLSKLTGLDLTTALFSVSPGGLTDMTLISGAYGADTPTVALLHLMRLLTVITVLPTIIGALMRWVQA